MDEPIQPPPIERLTELVGEAAYDDTIACLARFETASTENRKEALRALRTLAEEQPTTVEPLLPALTAFLDDDERSVRLTTAKLFVAVAESDPTGVRAVVSALADRLADDEEFYYVRARAAEALGYVALEHPDSVTSPEVLADLRVGLSFDEPEVKRKLAKALECVAIGDPGRLRHQVSALIEHADDEDELVRYHLCSALVAIACEHPGALEARTEALTARLDDENGYVRGRAAEGLGLLARSKPGEASLPRAAITALVADEESFVADRARFASRALDGSGRSGDGEPEDRPEPREIGTVAGVRRTTTEAVAAITTPDGGECPHCGLALGEHGPPMCPRCGAPY